MNILTKEDFSNMIDRKEYFEGLLNKEVRSYYDHLIWEGDDEEKKINQARQSGFRSDVAAIQAALDFTLANLTAEQLKEYKEYHYERLGKPRYAVKFK